MLKIISLFFMALVFVGCNNSSGTSNGTPPQGNPGNNDVTELGYDPDERWPDQGEFSYSHRYSYNGSICETGKQKFGNRADYCMGLQDQRRNNNCALSSRKSTYNKDCGYDFQELNFEGEFYRSGFDSHLKKQCSTSNSVTIFRNLKHYCDFLRDESLHQNCFWADRYKHFRAKECNGEFSHAPEAISDPIFTPEPTEPNPQPIQPEDPVQEIQVVKELKEQGIATRVDWDAIRRASSRPLPGEPSIQEKMNIVWSEIAANKNEIIKRKNQIRNLEITIYTDYRNHSDSKELAVDFETKRNEFKDYFPLFDKLNVYTNELRIAFNFIHSGSMNDAVSYLPMRKMIAGIERNFADLKSMAALFLEIKIDSYTNYFPSVGRLSLNRENLENDLAYYIKLLKPLGPASNWFRTNGIKLVADFKIEEQTREVYAAFKTLEVAIPSFDQMLKAGYVNEVSVYFADGNQKFYDSLKKLSLSIGPNNQKQVSEVIVKVGQLARMQKEGNVKITVSNFDLNENFNKSFSHLEKYWALIKPKINGNISSIELGSDSTYYSGLKKLILGYNSTSSQTEKVINEIR